MSGDRPRVGVAVIVVKDGKLLIGKRKSTSHGHGTWHTPGGHLEFGESFEECARREVREEAGVEIADIRFLTATNDVFEKEGKHYITVWMIARWKSGEPKVMEPEKCEGWEWKSWEEIEKLEPLFLPVENLMKREEEIKTFLKEYGLT